jgi:hypothetical protein
VQRFVAERSWHLAGLSNSDSWFVIYDVGYGWQEDAHEALAGNPFGFPLADVSVAQITSSCGDLAIAKASR